MEMLRGAGLDRIGVLLFDATLSTTLFSSLVMLAMLGCRQPARRILIARVALLASLAMIPLVALAPLPRLDLIDVLVDSELVALPVLVSPGPAAMPATAATGHPDRVTRDPLGPDSLSGPWAQAGSWLRRGLLFLDLAGVGAGLAWLLLGFGGVQWLIGRSRAPAPATQALFEQLITEGPSTAPKAVLRVSARIQHAAVVGMFRPRILIPTSLDQPEGDREAIRLSLLHEIAHIERSDHWFGTAASLAQTVWFFLPQVWWLRSQLVMDQEFLADRSAAQRYGSSFGYASSLLAMAAKPGGSAPGGGDRSEPTGQATGTVGIHSPLFQRVLMLVHCPFPIEVRPPHFWSWTSKLTLLAASLIAACLFVRWPDAAAAQQRTRPRTPALPQRFDVGRFLAEPRVVAPGGRSLPSVLPLALPPEFDLRVEVRATSAELAQIRIAGHALSAAAPAPAPQDPGPIPPVPADTWHRVHLSRDRRGVVLELDGQTVPVDPQAEPTTQGLTFEPTSQRATEFRNLVVAW
jgi:hypothetical protein